MKYFLDFSQGGDGASAVHLIAWQPSTWPAAPQIADEPFIWMLTQIFEQSILGEIHNVIKDAQRINGSIISRGHVLAISMMCAIDAIASYGYRKHHFSSFIRAHFAAEYHPYAEQIYTMYRNSLVHSWNLFEASIYPDNSGVRIENRSLAFGLIGFFEALTAATEDFLNRLGSDACLQEKTLSRYKQLRDSVKP